jgi:hypothetical protein
MRGFVATTGTGYWLVLVPVVEESRSEAPTDTCSQEGKARGYKAEKGGAKIVANCSQEVEAVL